MLAATSEKHKAVQFVPTQLTLFDYSTLEVEVRVEVKAKAEKIREKSARITQGLIEIGKALSEVRELLREQGCSFDEWLKLEFDWSRSHAYSLISVYETFGDRPDFGLLGVSAIKMLSGATVPSEVREEILSIGKSRPVPIAEVRDRIRGAKEQEETTEEPVREKRSHSFHSGDRVKDGVIEEAYDQSCVVRWDDGSMTTERVKNLVPEIEEGRKVDYRGETYEVEEVFPNGRVVLKGDERSISADTKDILLAKEPPLGQKQACFTSNSDEHYTPQKIIEAVVSVLGEIDLDPCSNSLDEPQIPAKAHYTINEDGLAQSWAKRVYINPPYSETSDWLEKLNSELLNGNAVEAIALVPSRTDTAWFQKVAQSCTAFCLIRGRLKFDGEGNTSSAPFPSAVFYWGKKERDFRRVFEELGLVLAPAIYLYSTSK